MPSVEDWLVVSEAYRSVLPFPADGLQVQVYAGFQHAIYEATRGLARLFSHKKMFALMEGAEPALQAIAVDFAEDAYDIRTIGAPERHDFTNWVAPLTNEMIFVLYAEDDPVTGRLYDHADWLPAIKEKRVFKIALSHAAFRATPLTRPGPFEVRILSLREDLALVVAGERFRVVPTLAPRLAWTKSAESWLSIGSREKILAFERALPAGFHAYFKPIDARVFDRTVIYHPGLDGSALLDVMAGAYADPSKAETTSPCRWRHPRFRDWLLARGDSEETVRGMIVIDESLIDPGLHDRLAAAAREVERFQVP